MPNDFAVFILTHGRAGDVITYATLRRCGYTGPIYLLVDDEDKQLDQYLAEFGEQVIVFRKQDAVDITDACDNYTQRNSVVYARNWSFVVAARLGIKYFWQLDDDYFEFHWSLNNDREYITTVNSTKVADLDSVIGACVTFLVESGAKSMAFAQAGDFIGGENSAIVKRYGERGTFSRKLMNTFFFATDNPVSFRGRVNEDANLYTECGRRGDLFVTVTRLRVQQKRTQLKPGGLTDIYKELGTYVKSFYSVMVAPSCVKIAIFHGRLHSRIHHAVRWKNVCPLIVDPLHRKA